MTFGSFLRLFKRLNVKDDDNKAKNKDDTKDGRPAKEITDNGGKEEIIVQKEEKEEVPKDETNLAKKDNLNPSEEDMVLLRKIFNNATADPPRYINLETGRPIMPKSAKSKKHITPSHHNRYLYCSNQKGLFDRISQYIEKGLLTQSYLEGLRSPSKTPNQTRRDVVDFDSPKEEFKRKKIPKTEKHYLWMRDYGNVAEKECICCGIHTVHILITEIGHIVPHSEGGTYDRDNLRLICRTCNADMGTQNMNDFMKEHNFPIKKIDD